MQIEIRSGDANRTSVPALPTNQVAKDTRKRGRNDKRIDKAYFRCTTTTTTETYLVSAHHFSIGIIAAICIFAFGA